MAQLANVILLLKRAQAPPVLWIGSAKVETVNKALRGYSQVVDVNNLWTRAESNRRLYNANVVFYR